MSNFGYLMGPWWNWSVDGQTKGATAQRDGRAKADDERLFLRIATASLPLAGLFAGVFSLALWAH